MDICISILILLLETLTILMYMHISFNKKIRFDKYVIGILAIACFIYLLINNKVIPQLCGVLVYGFIWLYCYKKFKLTVGRTVLRFLFGFVMATLSETIFFCLSTPLQSIHNELVALCLVNMISLGIVSIIYVVIILYSKKIKYKVVKSIFIRILLIVIVYVGLLFNYYVNSVGLNIYTVVIMVLAVFLFIYTYMMEQSQKEVEIKNLEIELQEVYGEAYKELLTEVRKRQHDFRNQLGAIYSMHLVAKSLDDLVVMQTEYGDKLLDNCKYDSILTCCDSSILAGYIYYRCLACEKEGIEVIYNIRIDTAVCSFVLHEIIEILGILIDNACENILEQNIDIKCIKLDLIESDAEIKFMVSNPAKYLTSTEIEKLFKSGYSTKGKNRGIGLSRILELAKEHDVEIMVRNYTDSGHNWIEFGIIESR